MWDAWSASIDAEDSADRTENEKTYQYDYSGYVLSMRCNIENIDGNDDSVGRSGFGCCLRDLSQDGGGYCMTLNSTKDGVDTYFLTEANFETVLSSPYDLSSVSAPSAQYVGITVFYIDSAATDETEYNYWTGYKV